MKKLSLVFVILVLLTLNAYSGKKDVSESPK
jgi:hypothetical protein